MLRDGTCYRGDLTAMLRTGHRLVGMARVIGGVGIVHWHWKHQDDMRRLSAGVDAQPPPVKGPPYGGICS